MNIFKYIFEVDLKGNIFYISTYEVFLLSAMGKPNQSRSIIGLKNVETPAFYWKLFQSQLQTWLSNTIC